MFFQLFFIILILSTNSRVIEDIYTIQNSIISNILKINYTININGTNNYIYTLKTKSIFFSYDKNQTYHSNNTIFLYNPKIKILFFLSINETNDNIFDIYYYSKHDIITDKAITAKINFELIKYFQVGQDFSFEMLYQLKEKENSITINFNDLKEVDLFNYLIYSDKSILYDNTIFYDYLKSIILKITLEKMNKNLIYYPESNALHYFNLLYDYFTTNRFEISAVCDDRVLYSGKVEHFIYDDIIRSNEIINFTNVEVAINYVSFIDIYENNDDDPGCEKIKLDFFMINRELKLVLPKLDRNKNYEKYCFFEAFEQIINKTRKALGELI